VTLRAILLFVTVFVAVLRLLLARQKRRAQAALGPRTDALREARARGLRERAALKEAGNAAAPSPALDDRGDRADHPREP
jgi:hypothetical protein